MKGINPTDALQQGDILKDLELYVSPVGGNPALVDDEPSCLGLVLSRNCKAIRAEFVLVAAIKPYSGDFQKIAEETPEGKKPSMDLVRRRFDAIRDGHGQPDQVYLGTLSGYGMVRYAARLDSIHTIQVPKEANGRAAWVEKHRIARLSDDHRRHIQARLFDSIAHEGFDDFRWWCDEDLEMLLMVGAQEINEIDQKIVEIGIDIHSEAGAGSQNNKKLDGLQKKKDDLEKKKTEKLREIEPYQQERNRRQTKSTD